MAIIKKFRIKSFKKNKILVALKKISLSFGERRILEDISFNIITGQTKPNSGSIFFDKINATNYPIYLRTTKFKIGYVPQYGGYFHDLTLMENLKAIAEILISDPSRRIYKINELISKFELDSVLDVKAKFLSGGQKKKLVIALALLGDPKVLLLDECFAALDVLTIKMLQQLIVNLQAENNIGICICDHQARDLLSCVDVAIILSNCKIIAQGTPSELINNDDAKSQYFGESFKFN